MQENYIDHDEKFKETARRSFETFIGQVGESMAAANKLLKEQDELEHLLPLCYANEGGPLSYQDLHEGGFLNFGATLSGPSTKEMWIKDSWATIILSGGGPASRLVIKQEVEVNGTTADYSFKVWYQFQDWGKYWLNVYVDDNTNELLLNWLFRYVDQTLEANLYSYFRIGEDPCTLSMYE